VESFDRRALEAGGFRGFVRFDQLDAAPPPDGGGVYVVVRESDMPPTFLDVSIGGRFKERDPTVDASILRDRWVDGCRVVYIGKAKSLRKRLRQFRDFGRGRPLGHWGGRYIWQVEGSDQYLVAWRLTVGDPRSEEVVLLARFRDEYGCLPFANISS
jgi:hypothetical protein